MGAFDLENVDLEDVFDLLWVRLLVRSFTSILARGFIDRGLRFILLLLADRLSLNGWSRLLICVDLESSLR